jgi:outer membrane protein X
MKKLFFSILMMTVAFLANAQTTVYKPFKVDFATGYAIPGGSGAKGGVLFAIEPKYSINDNLTFGLRFEAAVMARASNDLETAEVKASGSYLATGDYYFNTNKFRPFAGVGLGIFNTAAAKVDQNTGTVESGSKFGFAPRAGFEFGHFRFALEYNAVGKTGDIPNNYFGIKLGFFAGGGLK